LRHLAITRTIMSGTRSRADTRIGTTPESLLMTGILVDDVGNSLEESEQANPVKAAILQMSAHRSRC
jgi:hypothetical protein